MKNKGERKHCGDCESFKLKPGRRRGVCESRPEGMNSALYASHFGCNRFIKKCNCEDNI